MLDLGLNVSIHSDDPAYFGAYLVDNYRYAADALGLGADDITRLAENSIRSTFAHRIKAPG
jgi:adenosine deaminase